MSSSDDSFAERFLVKTALGMIILGGAADALISIGTKKSETHSNLPIAMAQAKPAALPRQSTRPSAPANTTIWPSPKF